MYHTTKQAWERIRELTSMNFIKDEQASAGAGYSIYRGENPHYWVSDLNDRLELNYPGTKSINFWIKDLDKLKSFSCSDLQDLQQVINQCMYKMQDSVNEDLAKAAGLDEVYNQLENISFRLDALRR